MIRHFILVICIFLAIFIAPSTAWHVAGYCLSRTCSNSFRSFSNWNDGSTKMTTNRFYYQKISNSKLKMSEVVEEDRNKPTSPGIFTGLKNLISGKGWKGDKTFSKDTLAKLGLNVVLAYGFVSNISYITCLIIAWVTHGKKSGLSPRAPGQWKSFLLVYSGLWAANNIVRPARFSLSLLLSPAFERIVDKLQTSLNLSRKWAIATTVFIFNIVITTSYLVFGLLLATKIAKVPLL